MEDHNFNISDAILKELKTQELSKQSHKRELPEQVPEKLLDAGPDVLSKLQAEYYREEKRRKCQNHLQDLRRRLSELKKLHDARVIIKKFSRLSIVLYYEKKQPAN
ncbi:hypothetical protein EYC80_010120 [Monilinia laxa]|uniref:Uncharacterized protein n=1 Tax=Monilinia laxa TaxID=61186 RepID=A0A5N6JPW4_MONLA|nr:hypothetical protein EYC80_010120 [Monilinia laxa]